MIDNNKQNEIKKKLQMEIIGVVNFHYNQGNQIRKQWYATLKAGGEIKNFDGIDDN